MAKLVYTIVEHDGGWAYTLNGVFSETHPTRADAVGAANRAAAEQRVPGDDVGIIYEDPDGTWRSELADGHDRPETSVAE